MKSCIQTSVPPKRKRKKAENKVSISLQITDENNVQITSLCCNKNTIWVESTFFE
jgi:hypothetical protein